LIFRIAAAFYLPEENALGEDSLNLLAIIALPAEGDCQRRNYSAC